MTKSRVDDGSDDAVSGLIDLSEVDLGAVASLDDDSVLASALRMIRDEIEHPEEAVAGFNASI